MLKMHKSRICKNDVCPAADPIKKCDGVTKVDLLLNIDH